MPIKLTIATNQANKLIYCGITETNYCVQTVVKSLRGVYQKLKYGKLPEKLSTTKEGLRSALCDLYKDEAGDYPGWDFMIVHHETNTAAKRDRTQILNEKLLDGWCVLNAMFAKRPRY